MRNYIAFNIVIDFAITITEIVATPTVTSSTVATPPATSSATVVEFNDFGSNCCSDDDMTDEDI